MKKFLRRILVKLRRIVGYTKFVAHIGRFNYLVDLDEFIDWAIYMKQFEPATTKAFATIIKPGMTVVDIGANSGFYSLLSAELVTNTGQVHAFEPTTYGFGKLTKNISLNTYNNIKTYKLGLSSKTFSDEVELASSYPLGSGVVRKWTGGVTVRERVDFIQLDDLGLKPDFIKIDTDGYEYKILQGARKTLENRPVLLFEFLPTALEENGDSAHQLVSYLTSLGYDFFSTELTPLPRVIDVLPANIVAMCR